MTHLRSKPNEGPADVNPRGCRVVLCFDGGDQTTLTRVYAAAATSLSLATIKHGNIALVRHTGLADDIDA
jgi:hypothetical protein